MDCGGEFCRFVPDVDDDVYRFALGIGAGEVFADNRNQLGADLLRVIRLQAQGGRGIEPGTVDGAIKANVFVGHVDILTRAGNLHQRDDHFIQAQPAVGDEDFSIGGKGTWVQPGAVGISDENPYIVWEQAVVVPKVGLGKSGLNFAGGVFITIDPGAFAAGLDEQALGGLADTSGFGMAVVAGEVDGEVLGEEIVEEGFKSWGAGIQPEAEGGLSVGGTEQGVMGNFVKGSVNEAEGLGAGAEGKGVFFQVQMFVGGGIGGETLGAPEIRPVAGFCAVVMQGGVEFGRALAADEGLAGDGGEAGDLGKEQMF